MTPRHDVVCGRTREGGDMKTIADRILDGLLGGDGLTAKTRLGVDRYELVSRIGRPMRDHMGMVTGWVFSDGSRILEQGGGWDTPEGWEAQR